MRIYFTLDLRVFCLTFVYGPRGNACDVHSHRSRRRHACRRRRAAESSKQTRTSRDDNAVYIYFDAARPPLLFHGYYDVYHCDGRRFYRTVKFFTRSDVPSVLRDKKTLEKWHRPAYHPFKRSIFRSTAVVVLVFHDAPASRLCRSVRRVFNAQVFRYTRATTAISSVRSVVDLGLCFFYKGGGIFTYLTSFRRWQGDTQQKM